MLIQLQKDKFIELIETIENYSLTETKKGKEKIEVLAYSYEYAFDLKSLIFAVVSERDPEKLYYLIQKKLIAKTIKIPGADEKISPKEFIEQKYDIELNLG